MPFAINATIKFQRIEIVIWICCRGMNSLQPAVWCVDVLCINQPGTTCTYSTKLIFIFLQNAFEYLMSAFLSHFFFIIFIFRSFVQRSFKMKGNIEFGKLSRTKLAVNHCSQYKCIQFFRFHAFSSLTYSLEFQKNIKKKKIVFTDLKVRSVDSE